MPKDFHNRPTRTATLIKRWLKAHEETITCDDCADHMDRLADILVNEASPIGRLREIQDHISECNCCKDEFSALFSILKMEQEYIENGAQA